jgi:phage repressor protein C with HTH and peptisase S24 domain
LHPLPYFQLKPRKDVRNNPNSALAHRVDHSVTVLGDSMVPEFIPGEIYRYIPTDHVFYDGIYVIMLDGCEMVKQVQRLPGGLLRVSSLNERYAPFEVEESSPSIQVLGHSLHVSSGPDLLFRSH